MPSSSDAVECVAVGDPSTAWLALTCEHASSRLPSPWVWPEHDRHLRDQHWAVDLGAADFTRALAARLNAPACLARFSRLLIDPNRALDSDTLFRDHADGRPIAFNTNLSMADRQRRIAEYYTPYHDAVARMVAAAPRAAILGVHSFTPCYEGQTREVEVGVLFDRDERDATLLFEAINTGRYDVRMNEPWSGRDGLMYGPSHHADRHARPCLEIELRQDRLADPAHVAALLDLVASGLRTVWGLGAPA